MKDMHNSINIFFIFQKSHFPYDETSQQHYQEALRLEDVSSAVGFNATYFSTLFKKETGQNFMDYLTELRIGRAKELLCGEEMSVQDVAEQVGYRDLKYFSRLFKKLTGVSPSDYKKLYK